MTAEAQALARLAGLLADRTRATFCLALLDGRAWTAGELARRAGVAPSTASAHLDQLIAGGLLAEQRQGRHRYVSLADARAAQLLEELGRHAGPLPAAAGLREATASAAMIRGRTCYDHLAGRLGVRVTDAMAQRRLLDRNGGWRLTDDGLRWLTDLGVDLVSLRASRRPLVRDCLDWTERRAHLAGSAGAALCRRLLDLGWIDRIGSQRAVRVTASGRRGLLDSLGISADQLA